MTALLLVPLAACGGDAAEQAVEELRASMAEGEAELTALVTAWGQDGTRSEYTLRCVSSAQGSEVEALAPELIAGVRARLDAEGAVFGDEPDAGELADIAGTISYELLCAISPRVPRVYIGL